MSHLQNSAWGKETMFCSPKVQEGGKERPGPVPASGGNGIVWPWKPGGPVLIPDALSAAGVLN